MSPYIRGWEGLSEYTGGIHTRTLLRLKNQGLFKVRKLGKTVIFLKEEIDEAIKEVQS